MNIYYLSDFECLQDTAGYIYEEGTYPGDSTEWNNNLNAIDNDYNSAVQANYGQTSSGFCVTFQVGATNAACNQIVVSFNNATTACLAVASTTVGIGTLACAQAAMTAIDNALTSVNAFMGNVGAFQNQLQYTVSNLTKSEILQQAGMAMLAQANAQPQQILKLLANM